MCLAIPLQITALLGGNLAAASLDGFSMEINVALVPGVLERDHVLVHAGFALEVLSPERAEEMTREIDEMVNFEHTP